METLDIIPASLEEAVATTAVNGDVRGAARGHAGRERVDAPRGTFFYLDWPDPKRPRRSQSVTER